MGAHRSKFSLLCVDDESPILKLLEETFAEENYHIHTATSGHEALDYLEKSLPLLTATQEKEQLTLAQHTYAQAQSKSEDT